MKGSRSEGIIYIQSVGTLSHLNDSYITFLTVNIPSPNMIARLSTPEDPHDTAAAALIKLSRSYSRNMTVKSDISSAPPSPQQRRPSIPSPGSDSTVSKESNSDDEGSDMQPRVSCQGPSINTTIPNVPQQQQSILKDRFHQPTGQAHRLSWPSSASVASTVRVQDHVRAASEHEVTQPTLTGKLPCRTFTERQDYARMGE